MAAGYFSRILEALEIAYSEKPVENQLRQQSHAFLEEISNDVFQLPNCWQWFLDLTNSPDRGGKINEARFWCLQACDKQIQLSVAKVDANLAETRVKIGASLRADYFYRYLLGSQQTTTLVSEGEVDWVVSRAISVYVALLATDYPQCQPLLIKQFIDLITDIHRQAPNNTRALAAAVDLFLRCLTQLDDTYLGDVLGAQTEKDREVAMRIKDGIRDLDIQWIIDVLSSVLSGRLFGLSENHWQNGGSIEASALTSAEWWVALCESAVNLITRLSVWVDLNLLRDPNFQMFYSLSLSGKLPPVCAKSSAAALQALCYKRMHPLAKISLINDYGVIGLITKGALMAPATAKEALKAHREFEIALGQAVGVIGQQILDCNTYILTELPRLEQAGSALQYSSEESLQFQMAGLRSAPTLQNKEEFAKLTASCLRELFSPALRIFASGNLRAVEGVCPFLKECFRVIKLYHSAGGADFVESAPQVYEMIGRMLSTCFDRIRFPPGVSQQELAKYDSFELDEDDGSAISEIFVCRKSSTAIFFKAFGAALQLNSQIALEFLKFCIQRCQAASSDWTVTEAFLTLYASMIDSWRDFCGDSSEIYRAMLSVLFEMSAQLKPQTCCLPDFALCGYIDCVAKAFTMSKVAPKNTAFPHAEVHSILIDVVLAHLQVTHSRRLARACARCVCRASSSTRKYANSPTPPADAILQALLRTPVLRLQPIRADPRLLAANFEDELTPRAEFFDNDLISTEDQVKLYEFIGDIMGSQSVPEMGKTREAITVGRETRAALFQCAFWYSQNSGQRESLPYGALIELTSRQLRCLGYLLKHEYDPAIMLEVRSFVIAQLQQHPKSWRILSSALMALRPMLLIPTTAPEENLPMCRSILHCFLSELQRDSGEETSSAFELLDRVSKMATFYSTVSGALARAIKHEDTRGSALAFMRELTSSLYTAWGQVVKGTPTKVQGGNEALFQIMQINLSLIVGSGYSAIPGRVSPHRQLDVHLEAFYIKANAEVSGAADENESIKITSLIDYLDFVSKEYQCDAVVRAYFECVLLLTTPDLAVSPVLLAKFNPETVIVKLLALTLNRHKICELVGVLLKFVLQGVFIDRPDLPPRVIPDGWRCRSILESGDLATLISKANTKNQLREVVLLRLLAS